MDASKPRTINVSSCASKGFVPDVAEVRIGLEGECQERNDCISEYNARFSKIKDSLVEAGVSLEGIFNDRINIDVHREDLYIKKDGRYYVRDYKIVGFEYFSLMTVRIPAPFELLPDVWAAVISTDEDASVRISYEIDDRSALKETLLVEAIKNGKAKAQVVADAAGMRLGMPVDISFSSEVGVGMSYDGGGMIERCCIDSDGLELPDFNPEPIDIDCDVDMVWEMLEG